MIMLITVIIQLIKVMDYENVMIIRFDLSIHDAMAHSDLLKHIAMALIFRIASNDCSFQPYVYSVKFNFRT